MGIVMTNKEFVKRLKDIAQNYKTLYVNGCFGAPLTASQKSRYIKSTTSESRKAKIMAASADTFGFDCVCLIKAVLWGWSGDKSAIYGGVDYESNGVSDMSLEKMMGLCSDVSTDFSKIEPGEAVSMSGHIGVYIGDGLAVESTSAWSDNVQITACNCDKPGYNRRNWVKHGKLPWIDYTSASSQTPTQNTTTTETEEKKVTISVTVLKRGAKGDTVKAMQALLNMRNNAGLEIDGSFGALTDAAVRNYQKSRGLEVDGSCGGNTWTALLTR